MNGLVKPTLIDLEVQKWTTGRKAKATVNDLTRGHRKVMRKSGPRSNKRSLGGSSEESPRLQKTAGHKSNSVILNETFDGVYNIRKDEYRQVFDVSPGIARSYHEEPVLYGFGAAPELPEGTPVTYQMSGVLFTQRIPYKVYGLAFALTAVLLEDGDHIHLGKIYSEHLAQSGIETQETLGSLIFDRAYNSSYPGGDGVSLASAAHPIGNGGTFSNILNTPAALSQTSLEQMLIQIASSVGNTGFKIRLNPMKLVIAPANIFQAEVLVKSVLRAGTANNDINPVKSMGLLTSDTAVITRQSSATQWGIKTDARNGLVVKTRRKLTKSMEGDFETDSMRYKFTSTGRLH